MTEQERRPQGHWRHGTWFALGALVLCLSGLRPALAGHASITGFQWHAGKNQAVFSLNGNFQYHLFTLSNPDRVVVDFLDARPVEKVEFSVPANSPIRDIRFASHFNGKGERDVIHIRHPAKQRGLAPR